MLRTNAPHTGDESLNFRRARRTSINISATQAIPRTVHKPLLALEPVENARSCRPGSGRSMRLETRKPTCPEYFEQLGVMPTSLLPVLDGAHGSMPSMPGHHSNESRASGAAPATGGACSAKLWLFWFASADTPDPESKAVEP